MPDVPYAWAGRDSTGAVASGAGTVTVQPPQAALPLMGLSVPNWGPALQYPPLHGGYGQWDVIRVYDFGSAKSGFNEFAPKAIALTDAGTSIQGGQASANALRAFLEDWYNGPGSAARRGCEIWFANGNEYADKVTNLSAFVATMAAMRAVVDDYPQARLGLDPTHFQEKSGLVQASLHAAAVHCHFTGWSAYPPGRSNTGPDPTFTKPVTNADATGGHLERCIQRTLAAEQAAGHPLTICIWEVGIGDDPNDRDHRPYYAAHSIARWFYERATELGLTVGHMLWWDQQKNEAGAPENVLSNEPAATSPSTGTAWRLWPTLIPEYGGTKPPNWPNGPKASWPTGA